MSDYTSAVTDVISVCLALPILFLFAITGDEDAQKFFLYPFHILTLKVSQLTNYLGEKL
jgi:hypothetical protein